MHYIKKTVHRIWREMGSNEFSGGMEHKCIPKSNVHQLPVEKRSLKAPTGAGTAKIHANFKDGESNNAPNKISKKRLNG